MAPFTPKPPVEKLPLIVRKDIRDNFEPRRVEQGKKLSDLLKKDFKINFNPNETFAYADDGWAKSSHGQMLASYLDAFVSGVERVNELYPEDGLECFNEVVTKSEVTIGPDDTGKFSYVGCDVKDGVFRILFGVGYLGTNVSDLSYHLIPKAINDAPHTSDFPLLVKGSIRKDYDTGIPAVRSAIAEIIGIPADEVILEPNFLANYKKLKASKDPSSWREEAFGEVALAYFQGLKDQLEYQKFKGDEMMQEGLLEIVHTKTFKFRVVDKLVKGYYNEIVIEEGVAYIQTTPDYWYCNTGDAAANLSNLL